MRLSLLIAMLSIVAGALGQSRTPSLPSRDPAVVIPLLQQLTGRPEVKRVEEILGPSDRQFGSGVCLFGYTLQDRSEIIVSTGDCRHLGWITRKQLGKPDQIVFELHDAS